MLWRGKPWGLSLFCWLHGVAFCMLAPLLLLLPSCFRASIYAVCSRKVSPLPLLDGLAVLVSSMPLLFHWMVRAILVSGCYCTLLCISVRIGASMYSCAVGDAPRLLCFLPPFVIFSLFLRAYDIPYSCFCMIVGWIASYVLMLLCLITSMGVCRISHACPSALMASLRCCFDGYLFGSSLIPWYCDLKLPVSLSTLDNML